MDQEDHRTFAREELNNPTELNVGERFAVKPIRSVLGLVPVVRGNYGIPALSGAVP